MIARAQQDLEDEIFRVLNCDDFKQRFLSFGCDPSRAEENAEVLAAGLIQTWVGDCIRVLEAAYAKAGLDSRGAFKNACVRVINEIKGDLK